MLRVAGEARIGRPRIQFPADAGVCVRIATGAPVPIGGEAVVKREDVAESPLSITISGEALPRIRAGDNIRREGENAPAGAVVACPGMVITPAVAGALASIGVTKPVVHKALRVAVVSTGDELVPPHASPHPWQLRDGNAAALAAFLRPCPWIESVVCVHAPDDEFSLDRAIARSLAEADALLLSGGVSAGHRDLVPQALVRAGVSVLFHRLPQRPGKPVLAGVAAEGRPVLALPGNPVSVLVTARRFALPALQGRAGFGAPVQAPCVSLANPDDKRIDLWWHRPVRMVGPALAELVETKGSGDLVSVARSDGFIELPPGAAGAGPWPYHAWLA